MAYAEKYRGCWYIRYKNESGRWLRKACGMSESLLQMRLNVTGVRAIQKRNKSL